MTSSDTNINVKEMPQPVAEPAVVGLIGIVVATLVLGATDVGWASHTDKSLMIPWVLCLGATAQLIAGILDFKRNNIFGGTAFTTYSLLWYSIALTQYITIFTDVAFDITHYALGLIGFLIFSIILTIASTLVNKTFFGILALIDLALIGLVANILFETPIEPVGVLLLMITGLASYAALAVLLNVMRGKVVLSQGSPIWKPE